MSDLVARGDRQGVVGMVSTQAALPDADITLREHQLSWRQDPQMPGPTIVGYRAREPKPDSLAMAD